MPHTQSTTTTYRLGAHQLPDIRLPTFQELQTHLPLPNHPDYETKRAWVSHILINNGAVFPDFATQTGRSVHLIDIRTESELAKTGVIPGSNWYPRDEPGYLDKIQQHFPSNSLIAVVDFNGVYSRHVSGLLRDQHGFPFAAVLAGGVRLFKIFGFSVQRSIKNIKTHKNEPHSIKKLEEFHEFTSKQQKSCPRSKDPLLTERFTLEQVAKHVEGDLIQWIKLSAFMVHGRLSCIDGRGGNGCIGTPGGDMGEMILLFSTYEHLTGIDFTLPQIRLLFQHRLETFGRFYLHTDHSVAMNALEHIKTLIPADVVASIEAELKQDNVVPDQYLTEFVSLAPESTHDAILDYLTQPQCIGCGHLKLMLLHPERYKVRPTLIKHLLRAFYEACFFDETSECDYVILTGQHEENGVLSIEMQNEIRPYTKIPLISPAIPLLQGNKQMFVSHPTIMTFLRKQQCDWIQEAIDSANNYALHQEQMIQQQQQRIIDQLKSAPIEQRSAVISDLDQIINPQDIIKFTALSRNAKKAFNPLVDLSADQHAAISLGFLAADLPIYNLDFDTEHSRCNVKFVGYVEPAPKLPQTVDTTTHDDESSSNLLNKTPSLQTTLSSSSSSTLLQSPMKDNTTNTSSAQLPTTPTLTATQTSTDLGENVLNNRLALNVDNPPLSTSNELTSPHQFGHHIHTDEGCFADHHGMVVRSLFPQSTLLPRASIVGSPSLNINAGNTDIIPQLSLTTVLTLPDDVHHHEDVLPEDVTYTE